MFFVSSWVFIRKLLLYPHSIVLIYIYIWMKRKLLDVTIERKIILSLIFHDKLKMNEKCNKKFL